MVASNIILIISFQKMSAGKGLHCSQLLTWNYPRAAPHPPGQNVLTSPVVIVKPGAETLVLLSPQPGPTEAGLDLPVIGWHGVVDGFPHTAALVGSPTCVVQ